MDAFMLGMGMLGKCANERLPALTPLLSTAWVQPQTSAGLGWGK